MNDKTKLWESVETTDPKYTKKVTFGRSFTAIDPQYQLLQGTKIWGSFGKDWGVKDESFNTIKYGQKLLNDAQVDLLLCQYSAILFYPDGEIPINSAINFSSISSKGKHLIDEDFSKKVSTNALSKGLSKLGFSADVFLGAFDGNMYEGITNTGSEPPATTEQINKLREYRNALKDESKIEYIDKFLSSDFIPYSKISTLIDKLGGM